MPSNRPTPEVRSGSVSSVCAPNWARAVFSLPRFGTGTMTLRMSSGAYDPAVAPDAVDWLNLDEGERLHLVETYHRRAGIAASDPRVHAALHTAVENQIAAKDPPAVGQALARLMAGGLDRHPAIHAVGFECQHVNAIVCQPVGRF